MDNVFFRTISKIVDLFWLNLLTLICCLPVITAGTALTAMYQVLFRIKSNQEGYITRDFFHAFRQNFKKTTFVWSAVLLILLFYWIDLSVLRSYMTDTYQTLGTVIKIGISIIMMVLFMGLSYFFPLSARYENKTRTTVKNAYLFACAYFPQTLCMMLIYIFPFALMMLSNYFILFWFLFGLSFPGYCCCSLLTGIFGRTEERLLQEE
ncbi:MAG: DUF624 domain-containing protein [Candidatus Pacebacteria bacterium]|nr:DUF624 domain-containing protein [Candidatus Paceibacterota bacterium]